MTPLNAKGAWLRTKVHKKALQRLQCFFLRTQLADKLIALVVLCIVRLELHIRQEFLKLLESFFKNVTVVAFQPNA
jgi:hypothetical protein